MRAYQQQHHGINGIHMAKKREKQQQSA